MLIDLKFLSETDVSDFVVVIGAGPAGISLCNELHERKIRTVLIESGSFDYSAENQSLNEGLVDRSDGSLPHEDIHLWRMRMFGGGSNIWGGACVKYDHADFIEPHSGKGWPIPFSEVSRYYGQAAEYFGIPDSYDQFDEVIDGLRGTSDFETKSWLKAKNNTNFGFKFRKTFEASRFVHLLTKFNLVNLNYSSDNNSVDSVDLANLDGRTFNLVSTRVVLCMGGIEIPRILLSSDNKQGNRLDGHNRNIGAFYSPHINITHGLLLLKPGVGSKPNYLEFDDAVEKRVFVSLKESSLTANPAKYLNVKWTLEPFGAVDKNVLSSPLSRLFYNSDTSDQLKAALLKKSPHLFALNGAFDQTPYKDSRISLYGEVDSLGVKKVKLSHRVNEDDFAKIANTFKAFAHQIGELDLGRFSYIDPRDAFMAQGGGASHHIGTTRMADDSSDGVVDSNCRVFGMSNLFICSSSIFPTPGHANPTYTIVAFAVRLAEFLSKEVEL